MSEAIILPPPLVKPARHPLKWTWVKAQTIGISLLLAHVGMFIVVGLYYLLFETWHPITQGWHNLISDSETRHLIRDVAEGFLGGFLAQQVIWNHFKKSVVKPKKLHLLDKVEIALRVPSIKKPTRLNGLQMLTSPLMAIVYAVPGFGAAILLTKWFHHTGHNLQPFMAATKGHVGPHATSYWDKVHQLWTGNWPKKLVGYGASLFFGRRPMRKVFDDVQLFFAERRSLVGKQVRFYHPPTFKARFNSFGTKSDTRTAIKDAAGKHDKLLRGVMVSVIPIGLALAGFGYYVLTQIAQ